MMTNNSEIIQQHKDNQNLSIKLTAGYNLNEHFQGMIVFADSKANFIISLSLGLLAGNLAIFSYNVNIIQKLIQSFSFISGIIITLYLGLTISIIVMQWIVFNCSISVIVPNSSNASKKSSVFYFNEVAGLNHDDFKKKFLDNNEAGLMDDIVYQVYDKSIIIKEKFSLISKASHKLKILLALTILHPIFIIIINLI